jgi:uncharacterized LabA/DUF88 family protein
MENEDEKLVEKSVEEKIVKNHAFIDGQNLHMGTSKDGWKVDFKKLRIYLKENYLVEEAHYFLGFISEKTDGLHRNLSNAGFNIVFKEHHPDLISKKKGNVDSDIIFEIMKKLIEEKDFGEIIIISGDGDYKKLIDYLIQKNKFRKILFPNKTSSSLYKKLGSEYFDYLISFRTKVEYLKSLNEKGS